MAYAVDQPDGLTPGATWYGPPVPNQSATAAPYGSTTPGNAAVAYQAVDPNETVSHQLTGLLADNSDYIQLNRAQAQQQAAGRGLLNSTMAAGAGQNAAIASALPIAQGNAQEYAQVGAANQQATNQYLGETTAANAQLGSASIGAQASIENAKLAAAVQREQAAQQFQEYGMGLGYQYAGLNQNDAQFKQSLAQSGAQFEQTLNSNVGQFQSNQQFQNYSLNLQFQNQTQQQQSAGFQAIMQNPNMTAADRQAALANLTSYYGQQSQYNATIPQFVPPWTSNPNYWSTSWTQ